MTILMKGAPVAAAASADLKERIALLNAKGITPSLALVRVGADPDDMSYERSIYKRCEGLGIKVETRVCPLDATQDMLEGIIADINADAAIHGCMLFRPIPKPFNEAKAIECLSPDKDVDGITATSLYGVFSGNQRGFAPCTAESVMRLLEAYDIALDGTNVTMVGRSMVVGRPLAMMLMAKNATVRMCHTHTRDLYAATADAEVVVVASGYPGTLDAEKLKDGQVAVDVGTTWDDKLGKLVGDIKRGDHEPDLKAISPVPGGVGALTNLVLAAHVVEAAERSLA